MSVPLTAASAVAEFGASAKKKLANPAATGQPEDPDERERGEVGKEFLERRAELDLSIPGLRIPLTADAKLFGEAVALGRTVIWLHTFGDRMADEDAGRPFGPPRLSGDRPRVPKGGTIPDDADTISYDAATQRLLIGTGFIENVPPAVWRYEVSGKQVLGQWFSYRRRNRERPIIGDRRPPSPLGDIQPEEWLPEYTSELLNLLNVLGALVELEPAQAALLEKVCAGALIAASEVEAATAAERAAASRGTRASEEPDLFTAAEAS